MKKWLFTSVMLVITMSLTAQEEAKKFGITFNGFVKTDIIWDSRQTVDVREGHFLLYPKNEDPDAEGNDINATPSFNFLSIQTRLRGTITGPDALGAKTSGAIEGEFFGHTDSDINGFRLRHAYVQLNWEKTELMVGQNWHPLFVTDCYPGVISFNTGAPFLPFTRNPQIRLSHDLGAFRVIAAALSQIDFKSNGPDGASIKYLRNTAVPMFTINLEYRHSNTEKGTSFLAGLAGGYKILAPRMVTDSSYKSDERVSSISGIAYLKFGFPKITFKLAGYYGQDAFDLTMLGGYAVTGISDVERNLREYTPVSTMSVWTDIHTNGKKWQGGLFLGYSKNLGSSKEITGSNYSRGSNIGYLYRISPRLIYNVGKFRIAPEIEYTVAAYGTPDRKGIVNDTNEIGNFRFLLGVFFLF